MFVIKNLLFIVMAMGLTIVANAQEQALQREEVPVEITDFIDLHFPASEVANVVKDTDDLEVTYEVEFVGGLELEFNEALEIVSIDGSSPLPDSVIPGKLLDYVAAEFPDLKITGWEWDEDHQILELDDDTELVFDADGNFLRKED